MFVLEFMVSGLFRIQNLEIGTCKETEKRFFSVSLSYPQLSKVNNIFKIKL